MELSPETLKTILNEGIELLYQVIPSLIYAIIFYLVGRFVVNKLLVAYN